MNFDLKNKNPYLHSDAKELFQNKLNNLQKIYSYF